MKELILPEVNSSKWMCIDDFDGEIWKDIPGYEGWYQVSNMGRIKSLDRMLHNRLFTGVIKRQTINQGYYYVVLNKYRTVKSVRVHRIVCSAFHKNNEKLPYVNHKNENKLDNRSDNLEWCTPSYNTTYNDAARKNGLNHRNNKINSYPVLQYDLIGNFIKEYPSMGEAYRQTGIYYQNIRSCFKKGKGRQLTAGGFIWILKNSKVSITDVLSEVRSPQKSAVIVEQFSEDGQLVGIYDSILNAARSVGINSGSISLCCRGITRKAGGYMWKVASHQRTILDKSIKPIYNNIRVNQYTLEGELITEHPSITAAAKNVGVCASSIKNCLSGITKTCGGYKWKVNNNKL